MVLLHFESKPVCSFKYPKSWPPKILMHTFNFGEQPKAFWRQVCKRTHLLSWVINVLCIKMLKIFKALAFKHCLMKKMHIEFTSWDQSSHCKSMPLARPQIFCLSSVYLCRFALLFPFKWINLVPEKARFLSGVWENYLYYLLLLFHSP